MRRRIFRLHGGNMAHSQLTAYLVSILVHHDRGIQLVGPPRNRQEWGIGRIGDYVRAIGQETLTEGDEAALWALLRESVALLPARREEGLLRLIRAWAPLNGWLDDQQSRRRLSLKSIDCRPLE